MNGILNFIRTRRPGDRLILLVLAAFVVLALIATLLSVRQLLLVTQPTYGGSLSEGEVGAPRFINPLLALSDTDQDLTTLTYAGLLGTGADGTIVPVLAQGYTVSPDGKTYTFTLRDKAVFSDGSPVTAEDVVYTVQKAQDPGLKSPQYQNWRNVSVLAVNSRTIRFTLPAPYAPFIDNATLGILPAHLWRNVSDDAFPFSTLMIRPVGAGPFTASKVIQDSSGAITAYSLSANANYALGRPYLDSLHFSFFDDLAALQDAISTNKVQSGFGVTGTHTLTAPFSRIFAVFFNSTTDTTLSDATVRKALSLSIDRTTIVQSILGGFATPLAGPVPAGSGIAALPLPSTTDRVATSTALLKAGGWTFATSTGMWQNKSGAALSIVLKTSNVPELKAMAASVQHDWEKIGVPTSIEYDEPGDLTQKVIGPRAYQALLFGMVVGKGDDLYDFWDSKERTAPGLNITGYNNSSVDTLLTKLRSDTDPNERAAYLDQINQLIAADYPAAFIESPDFVYTVPKNVKGVILPQITSPSDRFATVATWYMRTESVWPFLARKK